MFSLSFNSKTQNDQTTLRFLSVISLTTVLSQKRWKMRLWSTSNSATTASCCLDHVYQPEAFALLPLSQLVAAQVYQGEFLQVYFAGWVSQKQLCCSRNHGSAQRKSVARSVVKKKFSFIGIRGGDYMGYLRN